MAEEIEAKVKVDDHRAVRDALVAAGATRVGKVREVNTYFAVPAPDVGLRTRTEEDEHGRVRHRVTYKGPKVPGRFKRREEIEFDVSAAAAAGEVFERLGHRVALRFEKDRETFELDGCEVVLDTLPELGHFVEIEADSEAAVAAALGRLGLHERPLVSTGYASLVATTLKARGGVDLRF